MWRASTPAGCMTSCPAISGKSCPQSHRNFSRKDKKMKPGPCGLPGSIVSKSPALLLLRRPDVAYNTLVFPSAAHDLVALARVGSVEVALVVRAADFIERLRARLLRGGHIAQDTLVTIATAGSGSTLVGISGQQLIPGSVHQLIERHCSSDL